jgi:hydroxymethylglutaryl-CoA reductase
MSQAHFQAAGPARIGKQMDEAGSLPTRDDGQPRRAVRAATKPGGRDVVDRTALAEAEQMFDMARRLRLQGGVLRGAIVFYRSKGNTVRMATSYAVAAPATVSGKPAATLDHWGNLGRSVVGVDP